MKKHKENIEGRVWKKAFPTTYRNIYNFQGKQSTELNKDVITDICINTDTMNTEKQSEKMTGFRKIIEVCHKYYSFRQMAIKLMSQPQQFMPSISVIRRWKEENHYKFEDIF